MSDLDEWVATFVRKGCEEGDDWTGIGGAVRAALAVLLRDGLL